MPYSSSDPSERYIYVVLANTKVFFFGLLKFWIFFVFASSNKRVVKWKIAVLCLLLFESFGKNQTDSCLKRCFENDKRKDWQAKIKPVPIQQITKYGGQHGGGGFCCVDTHTPFERMNSRVCFGSECCEGVRVLWVCWWWWWRIRPRLFSLWEKRFPLAEKYLEIDNTFCRLLPGSEFLAKFQKKKLFHCTQTQTRERKLQQKHGRVNYREPNIAALAIITFTLNSRGCHVNKWRHRSSELWRHLFTWWSCRRNKVQRALKILRFCFFAYKRTWWESDTQIQTHTRAHTERENSAEDDFFLLWWNLIVEWNISKWWKKIVFYSDGIWILIFAWRYSL